MKAIFAASIAALSMVAGAAMAEVLQLTPASPQPSGLKSGLSVVYSYPADVKSLDDARRTLKRNKQPGPALAGLDYRDTNEGDQTLTSKKANHVVASIKGYIKFDAPGVYTIDFLTNDGLDARISGQRVGYFDGRQTCQETFATEVNVPSAGWYDIDVLYFQRLGTSCLHMRWGKSGSNVIWVPNAAFGY